jgi:hypothetical protein
MTKTIVDSRVKAKLDSHAQTINTDRAACHRITTHMRDGLTGYGECQNSKCQAGFNVGYPVGVANAEPIITDDSATGSKCPVAEFWEIESVQPPGNITYGAGKYRTKAEAMAAWEQAAIGSRLSHVKDSFHTFIGQK